MAIDWTRFEALLFDLACDELAAFAAEHREEVFYAFCFDCSETSVLFCVNTEPHLATALAERSAAYPDQYATPAQRDAFRYRPGDWQYHGFNWSRPAPPLTGDERWADVWEPLAELVREPHDHIEFVDAIARVARRLESTGAFSVLRTTADFRVFVIDHDEPPSAALARMARLHTT